MTRLMKRSALSQISVQTTKLGGLSRRKSSYQVKPSKIKVRSYIVQRRIFIVNPRRDLGQV
jgi:hypothetical protein